MEIRTVRHCPRMQQLLFPRRAGNLLSRRQGGYNLITNICPYSTRSLPLEPAGLRSISLGKAEASLQAEVRSEQLSASRKAKTFVGKCLSSFEPKAPKPQS